jgi:multiple sugar transport system substrate-binding protein
MNVHRPTQSNTHKRLFTTALSLLLTAGLILGLTACGATEPADPSNKQPTLEQKPPAKTKLAYWTAGRHDAEYIRKVIDAFNATNKDGIEVEMTVMAEDFAQALDLSFISDQSPDVFSPVDLADHYRKGYVAPLNLYMNPEWKERFGDEAFVEGYNVFDGQIYSLPNSGSTLRLIYNVEMLRRAGIAQPPKTLDELVEAARKITEVGKSNGTYGFALPYKNASSALNRSAVPIAEISGISGHGYSFSEGKYDFTGYKPIILAFKQMKDEGSVLPGSESLDIDPLRAQFANGKIGMYLSYSSEPGVYKNQFPAKIEWDAALPPSIDGAYKGVVNQGAGATRWLSMSSKSQNKDAAWKLLEYMYSDEVLIGYQEQGLGILSIPSVAKKAGKPDIAGIANFLPGPYDGMWPAPPQGLKPEGKSWQDEFVKYILVGGNLDTVITDLNARYNTALAKDRAAGKVQAPIYPAFDPMKLQGSMR